MTTIVSMPDFFNADVADLRGLETWQPGMPNGINDAWRRAIDVCLDEVEAESPDAVLVAGDLVEGRWDVDSDGIDMFGPNGTRARKLDCIQRAGDVYYEFWKSLFARRGLAVYPALGDHEIGDDRFRGDTVNDRWPVGSFVYGAVPTFKEAFSRAFTRNGDGTWVYPNRPAGTGAEGTAYAVDLPGSVTLVSVDVFTYTSSGVEVNVRFGQLEWLHSTLADARARGRTIIVQGHVPCLTPVRTRYSGGLHIDTGAQSALWQTMTEHGVSLYLCGEVHDVTATVPDAGPVQIAHGSLFHRGFNYLLIHDHGDGCLTLTSKAVEQTHFDDTHELWGPDARKRPAADIAYARGTRVLGTMHLDHSGAVKFRDGALAPYAPE